MHASARIPSAAQAAGFRTNALERGPQRRAIERIVARVSREPVRGKGENVRLGLLRVDFDSLIHPILMAGSETARSLPPPTLPPHKQPGSHSTADVLSDARRSPSEIPRASGPGFDIPRDETLEAEAPRLSGGFAPETAIDEQIEDLERWALANLRRDRNEKIRFWMLRGLAFIGASGAAVMAGLANVPIVSGLGALGALAIAIDSAWPSGKNPHQRAVHDLRELQNTIKLRWDKVRLAHSDSLAPQRIAHALALLDAVQAKREEIGKYLGNSEPSPGVSRRL